MQSIFVRSQFHFKISQTILYFKIKVAAKFTFKNTQRFVCFKNNFYANNSWVYLKKIGSRTIKLPITTNSEKTENPIELYSNSKLREK